MMLSIEHRKNLLEETEKTLSISRQCELLGLSRSSAYYQPVQNNEDLLLKACIDEIYTESPFYGSRRIAFVAGEKLGISLNRKRVQRLMRDMSIAGIGPTKNTSRSNVGHKIFPYLLRNFRPSKPCEVWSTDITYVRLSKGFGYLVAVIDWFSRYVLSWRLSNTMDVQFCIDAVECALEKGYPEIFNTDQGSQFTSDSFTSVLTKRDIKISMDGKGRALDNVFVERLWRTVKYEDIYIKGYETLWQAEDGLARYFEFYNMRRPHSSLGNLRPGEVHFQ